MEKKDRKRFGLCLLACAELYGKELSAPVAELWWDALQGYDLEAVEAAFNRHVQSPDAGQYMPKPADIIRMLAGTSLDAAMVAWAKVDKAARTIGPYVSVIFDDPLIMRVVQDMGGWMPFGTKTEDQWQFLGNEFRTRYQGYKSRNERPSYPRRLMGIGETENAKRWLTSFDIVYVGDVDKARQVEAGGGDLPAVGLARVDPLMLVNNG